MISEELQKQLVEKAGVDKQAVKGKTADKIVNYLIHDGDKLLIQEAENQLSELTQKINTASKTLVNIANVQKEFGTITDERAKTAIALYATVIDINKSNDVKGIESIKSAGYVTYAYLGGQARRNIEYNNWRADDE